MKASEINTGDKLFVKAGFLSVTSKPIPVVITSKVAGNAEGGFIFKTSPTVGSGHGLAAGWFEPRSANPYFVSGTNEVLKF